MKNSVPVAISGNSFTNRANATLYVPYGSKAAYEAADYWKEFKEIIEVVDVTDISQMDNVIYIDEMEAVRGLEAVISIKMKNSAEIRAFQFDLYLPQGVTVVKSAKGKIQGALSPGRLPDEDEHTLTFSEHDGFIRFLCGSQYDETFTGNDGETATLRVNITEDMEEGDHALQLKDMKLTETDISKFYTAELIETTVTIGGQGSYVVGDVNGDGDVDTQDAIKVIQHYLGKNPTDFNAQAADVNDDGDIDTQDAILII